MHPTLTQVPPSFQVFPRGEGLEKSAIATLNPNFAVWNAQDKPPDPPPLKKS